MKFTLISLLLLTLLSPTIQALTVQEAYNTIPHARTPYKQTLSTTTTNTAVYLQKLFTITDQAVIARVSGMRGAATATNYQAILQQLDQLKTPASATSAHTKIRNAIVTHQKYFQQNNKHQQPNKTQLRSLQKSSSRELISAYQSLMQSYKNESKHNKQAFYDHLCALDFL